MGLRDFVKNALPGSEEPDAGGQEEALQNVAPSRPQPADGLYDGYTSKEIAGKLKDMDHSKRTEALRHDEFIEEEWQGVKDAIDSDQELSEAYGVQDQQQVAKGGGEFCKHHAGTKIRTESYQPAQTTVVHQSHETNEAVNPSVGAADTSIGAETSETRTAGASRAQSSTFEMTVCKADKDGCPTSLKGFYNAADEQYKRRQSNTNDYNQAWEQEAERANEVDRDGEQERAGHEQAQEQSAEAEQDTGEFVFDDEPQSVDEEQSQTLGEPDVEQSQEFELSR